MCVCVSVLVDCQAVGGGTASPFGSLATWSAMEAELEDLLGLDLAGGAEDRRLWLVQRRGE